MDFNLLALTGMFIVIVGGTVALTLGSYGAFRVFGKKRVAEKTQDLANAVAFRVAALHGLILALVYAQEMIDYQHLRDDLIKEATAIADIFNDIDRFGGEHVATVRTGLAQYVFHVIHEEWDLLGREDRVSPQAWREWESLHLVYLDLPVDTPRQQSLRAHMIENSQLIAHLRQDRENTAASAISPMFWASAVAGIVLIAGALFVFPPTRIDLILISIFGLYSGIIMFFIYAFSNPFSPPGALDPIAFEKLLDGDIGRWVNGPPMAG